MTVFEIELGRIGLKLDSRLGLLSSSLTETRTVPLRAVWNG